MVDYSPKRLLEFVRDGLVETEHSGFIVKISKAGEFFKLGVDEGYPFYLRSAAKPLQAALLVDFELDKELDMSLEEIAICCSSHSGEGCHLEVVKKFLDKIGLNETYLKCGIDLPLSKSEQKKLILSNEKQTVLHNNCSGKHAMMLGLCKKMGWGLDDYFMSGHPLQLAMKDKIYELCEINTEYPVTKDGCGVPICSMPLENAIKGFLNLFLDPKYSKIKDAFTKYPYLIAGEKRLDTAIMSANPNLICKSGACGIHVLVNLETQEGLAVKILESDAQAQSLVLIDALRQLGWLDLGMLEYKLIKDLNQRDILTLHGEKVGEAKCIFDLSFMP